VFTGTSRTAFDIGEFYSALDAERSARGLTWAQVTREINSLFRDVPARPMTASTLTGMRGRRAIEGNGVLQMLIWLGRTPESFTSARDRVPHPDEILPRLASSQILRFDTPALYAALDAQRAERGMLWREVAAEIGGVSPASLTRLALGGRVAFPDVMRIVEWLGRPVASFTRGFAR
jgi:hypothetical protein